MAWPRSARPAPASAGAGRCRAPWRVLATLAAALGVCAVRAAPAPAAPCSGAQYRQFDFWVGDWDVFDFSAPGQRLARVTVEPILKGCGVLETYADGEGQEGRSFSIYDASRRVWHQTWITNHGQLLMIEGGFKSGRMELAGSDLAAYGGPRRLVRGSWQAIAGGVREIGLRSVDGGTTWVPWFDLMFRRHAAP